MRGAMAWTVLLVIGLSVACTGNGAPVPLEDLQLPEVRADSVVLELGSYDGSHDAFTRVAAVVPGNAGALAVLLHPENEVRVFDADGGFLHRFAGRGQGPGEFVAPRMAGTVDGRIWVLDQQLRRLSFFDWQGSLEGTLALREDPPAHDEVRWRRAGVLAGDRLLLRPAAPRRFEADSLPLVTLELREGSEAADTLVRLARPARTPPAVQVGGVHLLAAGTEQGRPPVTADHTLVAPAFDGRSVLLAERHASPAAGKGLVRLVRLSVEGDEIAEVQLVRPRASAPPRAEAPSGAGSDFDDFLDYLYQEDHLPVATELRAGVDGSVWVGVEGTNETTEAWWIFDENLEPVSQVRLEAGLEVMQVAGDRVWTVKHDDLGIPRVQLRLLTPAGGG